MRKWRWPIVLGIVLLILGGAGWWIYEDTYKYVELVAFKADAPSNVTVAAENIPFQFTDRSGNKLDLHDFRGKSAVVLVVVRGLQTDGSGNFCQFCIAQTSSLMANYKEFTKREAEVVMVFPGTADDATKFGRRAAADLDREQPPFPVVFDYNLAAVKKLGIDNAKDPKAKPSTYILDKQGNVVYGYVGAGMTDRPSVAAILKELDKLNGT